MNGWTPAPETDSEILARLRDRMTEAERAELSAAVDAFNAQAVIADGLGYFHERYFWAQNELRFVKSRIAQRIRQSNANPEFGHSV